MVQTDEVPVERDRVDGLTIGEAHLRIGGIAWGIRGTGGRIEDAVGPMAQGMKGRMLALERLRDGTCVLAIERMGLQQGHLLTLGRYPPIFPDGTHYMQGRGLYTGHPRQPLRSLLLLLLLGGLLSRRL